MKSTGTYLIAVLALTTIGGAALAWHQYQELSELRAAALNKDERADWQKRVWDLEKRNRELSDQLDALRAESGGVDDMIATADTRPARNRGPENNGRGGRGGGRGPFNAQQTALRELFAKPEVQAMINQQLKFAVADRYGALIRNLNLSPERAAKLQDLLVERQTSLQDVLAAARDQGIDPRTDREGFQKLLNDARNEVDNSIKSLLGDAGYAQLQNYEQTGPQRATVDQINRRLAANGDPLSPAQQEQLVGILAANAPARPQNQDGPPGEPGGRGGFRGNFGGGFGGGGDLGALAGVVMGGGGGFGGGSVAITPAAVNQAQGVLSTSQLAALQQVQQQQQQAQQLRQLVNETMSTNPPQKGPRRGG